MRRLALRAARALVRIAATLVPASARERFVREWDGELTHETERGGGWKVAHPVWGAFADARTLRALAPRDGRWSMVEGVRAWRRDLWLAVRGMRRSPGFAGVAVLTLALGLGGTSAIYTLLRRTVLDPLPYPDPDRLVRIENQVPGVAPDAVWNLSTAQWVYLTDHASTLDAVGLYRGSGGTVVTGAGAERVQGVWVTASMVPLLGARAEIGRLIAPDDDRPGAAPVVVLSHGFWTRAFGGDRSVVGSTLTYDDRPMDVIGVLEEGVVLPGWSLADTPDVWLPLRIDRSGQFWNSHVFPAVGKLAPGASPATVEAEIAGLMPRLPERFPDAYSQRFFDQYGFRTQVKPLKDHVLGDLARNLWILFGGIALVLVIAAANVANLFLVRMESRRQELGVRASLGADRVDLARLVLAESLSLTLVGAAVALAVGFWAVPALTALAPTGLPRIHGVTMDAGTVTFTLLLSVLVALGIAAYPLLVLAGPGAARDLAVGGRAHSASRQQQVVRGAMLIGQVGLALTLVVGAGLLLETLASLRRADPGIEPDGVVTAELYLSYQRYPDDVAIWGFYRDVLDRVRALPGVTAAGMTEELPVAGGFGCTVQAFADSTVYDRIRDAGLTTCAGQEPTTPGYFETLGIPLLDGRAFTDADNDRTDSSPVIVSRAFAERFWPGERAVGQGLAPNGRTAGPFHEVVGVVADVARRAGAGEAPFSQPAMAVYYPIRKHPRVTGNWNWWPGQITLVVRTNLDDPESVLPGIRRAISSLDPEVPLANLTAMQEVVAGATAYLAFMSLLLSTAAAVALTLAAVGLYGVVSYVVSRRTREIGTRLAIGARPGEVQRMVVGQSLVLVAIGLGLGVLLSLATTRVLEGLLAGVEPTRLSAYVLGSAVLAGVALLASWLPARRAARIDPMEALRPE